MKLKNFPEPRFYTAQTLAEKWRCSMDSVLNYALTGQLQLSVESQGWLIEYGSIEEDDEGRWFSIPEEVKKSRGVLLKLSLRDQRELVRNGFVTDPSFQEEEYAYASASSNGEGGELVVRLKDVIIDPVDAVAVFDGEAEEPADEEEMSLEVVATAQSESTKPPSAVACIPRFYEEGIKIYGKILMDTGKDPNLQTVLYKLHDMPEFNRFSFETIKRYMKKGALVLKYQNSKKG